MLGTLVFWVVDNFTLGVGFRRWAYNISPKGTLGTYPNGLGGSLFARTWNFPFMSFYSACSYETVHGVDRMPTL
jgi:hypothetical protein